MRMLLFHISPIEIVLAFLLDALIGDPKWLPHPVRLIGRAIEKMELALRPRIKNQKLAGVMLVVVIVGAALTASLIAIWALRSFEDGAAAILARTLIIYLVATTISLRGLVESVKGVLQSHDLDDARKRLSHIVGRDTQGLDKDGVRRAAVETLAENTSDGVVAPLFYLAIGGLPLAVLYKAVNTLDSMVGYKNEEYIKMGWASARLDDLLNYVPARITGLLLALAALLMPGARMTEALRVMLRDGRKHPSPNAGVPEAAVAGALGIRLGGPSTYGGKTVEKPFIGDEKGSVSSLRGAVSPTRLAVIASALGLMVAVCLRLWI
jgi:adenosylcobinamide-phosphate synthase